MSKVLSKSIAFILCCLISVSSGMAQNLPPFWDVEWPDTDFERSDVPFSEIISGGVPRDAIPALAPEQVVMVAMDENVLPPFEPVVTVTLSGQRARAYPIRYLTWHEIANDIIGDIPVAVTFCPLCNSALVFDRRVAGQVLDFGVSGKLRHSDMIMFDRQTESWWQQFTGHGIVGQMTGQELTVLASWMESYDSFATRNPEGLIMAEPLGYSRPYGQNPYVNYDSSERPFLYTGENPPYGIEPLSRVVRVGDRAWPLARLGITPLEEAGVRITWQGGMASALDTPLIGAGRDIGQIRVQDPETGQDLVHEVIFAFAFHAFEPDGIWMLSDGGR